MRRWSSGRENRVCLFLSIGASGNPLVRIGDPFLLALDAGKGLAAVSQFAKTCSLMETAPPLPPSLPPPPPSPPPSAGGASADRMWPVLCHVSAFAGLIIPFGFLIGLLLVWLLKHHENPDVEFHGKESLNFQITMLGYAVIGALLGMASCGIGWFLMIPLVAAWVVFTVIASVKASNGEPYRYPLTLRLIT